MSYSISADNLSIDDFWIMIFYLYLYNWSLRLRMLLYNLLFYTALVFIVAFLSSIVSCIWLFFFVCYSIFWFLRRIEALAVYSYFFSLETSSVSSLLLFYSLFFKRVSLETHFLSLSSPAIVLCSSLLTLSSWV